MASALFYQERRRRHITQWLLMPDHLHALLSFPIGEDMSLVIGDWKRFHARRHGVTWQDGYFDHRLRDDERGEQLEGQATYIYENPVVRGLCARAEDWQWVYPRIER